MIVSRRLRDANNLHASRLAERCTINSSSQPLAQGPDTVMVHSVVHPLALSSLGRTSCPHEPSADGITGGSSSSFQDNIVSDVQLSPLERAAPHRIVAPAHSEHDAATRADSDGFAVGFQTGTWNTITALSALIDEVSDLERTFTYDIIPSLVLFHVPPATCRFDDASEKIRDAALLKSMGRFVPTLQSVDNGCVRLKRLVRNMVAQLAGCTCSSSAENRAEMLAMFGSGVSLILFGKAIGTALRLLITVDSAVSNNDDLKEAWGLFKDVVVDHSEERRASNNLDAEFETFEQLMIQLDYRLMSCRSFISAVEQNFDPNGKFPTASNFNLHEELHSIVIELYSQCCERINTEYETIERLDCVGAYAIYVMYRYLLPTKCIPDAKLHENLWSVFPAMCPVLELYGPLHFLPREFIMIHAPYEAVCTANINDIYGKAAALVLKWDRSFNNRVRNIRLDALAWLSVADAELSPTVDGEAHNEGINAISSMETIERTITCVLRGIKIAHSASITLRSQLIAHRALDLDLHSDDVTMCLSLVAVLKSVEKMLRFRRRTAILAFQRSTLKMIASNILQKFENIRAFVDQYSTSESSRSVEKVGSFAIISACLSALEGLLKGSSSFSPIRRHSISLTIAACMDSTLWKEHTDDMIAIKGYLRDLNEMSSLDETVKNVCDCSFLYFYRDIMYPNVFSLKPSVGHAHLVIAALSDPEQMLKHVKHTDYESCLADYQSFIVQCIREKQLAPLCASIELNLRFACHSNADHKLSSNDDQITRDLIMHPFSYKKKINLKYEVEAELGKTFYNLCALSLNDCGSYSDMRSIANERYGLDIFDSYLPGDNLMKQFDLIDILGDFESFIRRFRYNMIEQTFVESKPKRGAKFLVTFGMKYISASIARHGLGVIRLVLAAADKLLAQNFERLNEFLANDSVKSLLAKELRWMRKINHIRNEGGIYPFDRAFSLTQQMNKIDTADGDGTCSLGECCNLLVSIGNIIAFIRLLSTASRNVANNKAAYLYLAQRLSLGHDKQSLSHLDERTGFDIDTLISDLHYEGGIDHIQTLIDVGRDTLQKSDATDGFFCLVPALSLIWMEASIQGKEIMHKKNITGDGYYTNDGFAIGLTFCLLVLDQIKHYESLNWFNSVLNKYTTDEEDLTEKENAEKVKAKVKDTATRQSSWFTQGTGKLPAETDDMTRIHMMRKYLEGNKREIAMLHFTMHGAKRFFADVP